MVGGIQGGNFKNPFQGIDEKIRNVFDSAVSKMPDKANIGKKLGQIKPEKISEGLKNGTIKCLKTTGGSVLLGLSLIARKNDSASLAEYGLQLLGRNTDSAINYAEKTRKELAIPANKILGKMLISIGRSLEKIETFVLNNERVTQDSPLFKAGLSIGQTGSSIRIEGEIKKG